MKRERLENEKVRQTLLLTALYQLLPKKATKELLNKYEAHKKQGLKFMQNTQKPGGGGIGCKKSRQTEKAIAKSKIIRYNTWWGYN